MYKCALFLAALVAPLSHPALAQSVLNLSPSRVVGQPSLNFRSGSPNVVEGREFYGPVDVTVDLSTPQGPVYVADYANNRVLGWRNSQMFVSGSSADLVLGQLDRVSTVSGRDARRSGGLTLPTSVAVDARGNLYVLDAGSNRIVRFPRPAASSDEVILPDLVVGQPDFNTFEPNARGLSARSLSLNNGGNFRSDIVLDAQGNLWVTDSGNNRVLRYPASVLQGTQSGPAADVVLGQQDFTSNSLPAEQLNVRIGNKSILSAPQSLAFDSDGRLYVGDYLDNAFGRVLVYPSPAATGRAATRIAGVPIVRQGQQLRVDAVLIASPTGLFANGNRLGVVDGNLSRITLFEPFPQWTPETEDQFSPAATTVIGQQNFNIADLNRGQTEPSASSLAFPGGTFFTGTELYVADTANNRVLVFPGLTNTTAATRVLGQPSFTLNSPNVTEGRELFVFNGFSGRNNLSGEFSDGAGIAIDRSSAVPHLYIADTFNNRILGFNDVRNVRPGDRADIVIGQNDFNRILTNAPSNAPTNAWTNSGLYRPSGLAVDANGDLYVADSGNGRVLRFPRPFSQDVPAGERRPANLVLGQLNFSTKITDATARNMAYPFGIAFTVEGSLVVSDAVHSRLLFFRRPANGDFTNGQAAERVIGQPDFFSAGGGTARNRLNSPRHIAIDTDDRLYVTDPGNNRVLVYDSIRQGTNDPEPAYPLTGVNAPQGIWVSPFTGEIWVANTRGDQATRFPRYEQLAISNRADYNIPSGVPLALTQDPSGNLYIIEGSNRTAGFFNALALQIAGNFAQRPLAPGAIAIVYPAGQGVTFASSTAVAPGYPLPTELADIQVLLNEQPLPLYVVTAGGQPQINFVVPMSAPTSGTGELQIIRRSTGQVIGISTVQFAPVAPALFSQNGQGQGQLAALNQDNTLNSPSNPAAIGSVVQLFGTGQGFIPNAPPDGVPPAGPVSTPDRPRVYLGGRDILRDEDVLYSGLAPGLVGVWQINARVPPDAAVGQNDAFVLLNSVSSIQLPNGARISTVISVRR